MNSGLRMVLLMLVSAGCAHMTPTPYRNEVKHLESKKNVDQLTKAVVQVLTSNNFRIKTLDKNAGILTTEPREYKVSRGLMNVIYPGRAALQIIFGASDLQVQIFHECFYGAVGNPAGAWSECNSTDSEFLNAAKPEEEKIVAEIRKAI